MYVLAALSIVGLAVAIERFKNLRSERIVSKDLMEKTRQLWKASRFDDLREVVERKSCILGQVIGTILSHRSKPFETLSIIASDTANSAIRKQNNMAYPLNVIATLSPLLGLLGTIIGLIQAFQMIAITGVSGDASIVADGISKALVSTGAGLVVGIAALGLHHYFKNRISYFSSTLEESVNAILLDLVEEGDTDNAD